jgi:polysaccharide biosynthesis/export protein
MPWCMMMILACVALGFVQMPAQEAATADHDSPEKNSVQAQQIALIPGDELRIDVYDNQDLNQDLKISRDPINFPLIGDVGVLTGMSTTEIQKMLTAKLADGYIKRPVVTVTVRTFAPRTAAVLGSVRNPQRIDLSPFGSVTALQAIAQAGGLTDEANASMVTIIRRTTPEAPAELIRVSVSGSATDVALKPADVILVPRNDRLYVMGEVEREGPVDIDPGQVMTVSRAISVAGGFKRYAKRSKVQMIRDGQTSIIDVSAILDGKGQEDPVVKPGDSIFVPDSLF